MLIRSVTPAAVLAVSSALQRLSFLFISDHTAHSKYNSSDNNQKYNNVPHQYRSFPLSASHHIIHGIRFAIHNIRLSIRPLPETFL